MYMHTLPYFLKGNGEWRKYKVCPFITFGKEKDYPIRNVRKLCNKNCLCNTYRLIPGVSDNIIT